MLQYLEILKLYFQILLQLFSTSMSPMFEDSTSSGIAFPKESVLLLSVYSVPKR